MSGGSTRQELEALLRERIVVLDGAMGTMLQREGLDEAAFRGEGRLVDHPVPLQGCNDILCLTQPAVVEGVHRAYLDAGAQIIETNTFNATATSLADYQLEGEAVRINEAAARCARRAADAVMAAEPGRRVFVAGSMGPTSKTTSLSPDVNDPGFRAVTFRELRDAYYDQVDGLVRGGVDLLLPETSFDTLNMKAALYAIEDYFDAHALRLPVIASVTITDLSGRTLSGQTVEAFWLSVRHADLTAVSMNCALGATQMRPHLEELARVAHVPILCFPNAGLPNEMGEYDQGPDEMASIVASFAGDGLLNMVGGCCGTTPDHIRALARAVAPFAPRTPPPRSREPAWSGLEPYAIYEGTTFTMVGERTNVSGSRRFRKLVRAGDYEGATRVARKQVEGGANILDVNMDDGMLDGPASMRTFLNHIAAEPDISRVPIMIDSSRFEIIEAGLECVQGRAVVNSVSLKEGEAELLRQARICRRHGAAVVVMAFDEEGQATDTARRVAICERAFRLLTEQAGFLPEDVIFDPNILAIGTGMEEHDNYAISYIEATRAIKARCKGALVSGGVSNLSFAFRGNNAVREAIHAVFLYHAIEAGMDMGIVNAGQLALYDEIPEALLTLVCDLVLNRRPDATERLVAFGERFRDDASREEERAAWRDLPVEERIEHALLKGIADHAEEDMAEALERYPSALAIIEGPLMAAMGVIGDLFGAGRMFLPQVVKSARVMKRAVAYLEPYMEESGEQRRAAGRVIMATVKGDVHDIGKNIVGVVLRCNGYEVEDLGVMVPADRILDAAVERGADVVGLSGLITPSLDEMVHVAREMTRRGLDLPLLIGGATTSKKHTAVKIAPAYEDRVVLHVLDASRSVPAVSVVLSETGREALRIENAAAQATIRERYEARRKLTPLLALTGARGRGFAGELESLPTPAFSGAARVVDDVGPLDVAPLIDWGPFFRTWELKASWRRQLEDPEVGPRYRELLDDAQAMIRTLADPSAGVRMRAVYGFFGANARGDDVVVWADEARKEERCTLHMLRQQEQRPGKSTPHACLADYVARQGADHVGAFVVTAGLGLDVLVARFEREHDDYQAILARAVADRLAEAFTEHLHRRMRAEWGFPDPAGTELDDLLHGRYRGIRPAPGYPACPDHTEKQTLFDLLDATDASGVALTEHFAMLPAASVSGLVFHHPQARYFGVGRVGRDQVEDYARRKGVRVRAVERWLSANLGYEVGDE